MSETKQVRRWIVVMWQGNRRLTHEEAETIEPSLEDELIHSSPSEVEAQLKADSWNLHVFDIWFKVEEFSPVCILGDQFFPLTEEEYYAWLECENDDLMCDNYPEYMAIYNVGRQELTRYLYTEGGLYGECETWKRINGISKSVTDQDFLWS